MTSITKVPPSGAVIRDMFYRLSNNKEVFFYHVRTVGDLINLSYEPVTLDTPIKDVWQKMDKDGLKDLPVVEPLDDRKDSGSGIYVGTVRRHVLATMLSKFVGAISQPAMDDRTLQLRISNADAIDREIAPLTMDSSLIEAIEIMVNMDVECLGVVDENKNYLGALSSIDILNCYEYLSFFKNARTQEQTKELRIVDLFSGAGETIPTDKMLEAFVGTTKEVMRESVPSVGMNSNMEMAINLLQRHDRKTIVVMDTDHKVKGITTHNEIQLSLPPIVKRVERRAYKGQLFSLNPDSPEARAILNEKVGTVMLTKTQTVTDKTPVTELAKLLTQKKATELPVLTDAGAPLGIVGRNDLLKAFAALAGIAKKRGLTD